MREEWRRIVVDTVKVIHTRRGSREEQKNAKSPPHPLMRAHVHMRARKRDVA